MTTDTIKEYIDNILKYLILIPFGLVNYLSSIISCLIDVCSDFMREIVNVVVTAIGNMFNRMIERIKKNIEEGKRRKWQKKHGHYHYPNN